MPKRTYLSVKEEHSFLSREYSIIKHGDNSSKDRIFMLIIIKDMNGFYISEIVNKIQLETGRIRDRGTIKIWIEKYINEGFDGLMSKNYENRGFVLTREIKEEIQSLIFNSNRCYDSINELKFDIDDKFKTRIKENTLRKHIKKLISMKEFKILMDKRVKKQQQKNKLNFRESLSGEANKLL